VRLLANLYAAPVMTRAAVPPYLRVYAELKRRIEARDLGPGEQVPSATQLAEEFRVSRSTARRALALLKEQGYTDASPGWGTFVRDRTGDSPV
jgi:DNA-binding GntR family transcriptional regulator